MSLNLPDPKIDHSSFSPEALDQAMGLVISKDVLAKREPNSILTIDSPGTINFEDGIYSRDDDQLGVSVVDPSIFHPRSPIVLEALSRGEDFYTPQGTSSMLPEEAKKILRLSAGDTQKLTVTSLVKLNSESAGVQIADPFATASLVSANLSYKDAQQKGRNKDSEYFKLDTRLRLLSEMMRRSGDVLFDPMIFPDAPSSRQRIMSLVDISNQLFNLVATEFAQKNNIPVLYTNQQVRPRYADDKKLLDSYRENPDSAEIRRRLYFLSEDLVIVENYSTKSKGHFGLGAKCHAVFSRPLRDAVAMVNMMNLSAWIRGEDLPFSEETLKELGPYLTHARNERIGELKRTVQLRVESILDNESYELKNATRKEFRKLIEVAIHRGKLPIHIKEELTQRLEDGRFGSISDMALIAAGPPPNDPEWEMPRSHFLKWLNKNSNLAISLFHHAHELFTWFESGGIDLERRDKTIAMWPCAVIRGKSLGLSYKTVSTSANIASRAAAKDFWEGYLNGSLIETDTPPKEDKLCIANSRIPDGWELPTDVSEEPDLTAADKLHITAMVLNIRPPKFEKEKLEIEGKPTMWVTSIYGLMNLDPTVGTLQHSHSGRATNLTSSQVLAQIRAEMGVENISAESIFDARFARWTKRLKPNAKQANLLYGRNHVKPALKFGPFIDLVEICRIREWGEPVVENSDDKTSVTINAAGETITKEVISSEFTKARENQAAIQILESLASRKEQLRHQESTGQIPLGYILKVDPVRELQLLCIEAGHKPPKLITEESNNEDHVILKHTLVVKHKEGQEIIKRASGLSGGGANYKVFRNMLQELRPEYSGSSLYLKKLELLKEQHGFEIDEPTFSEEPLAGNKDVMLFHCAISLKFMDQAIKREALGITKESAHILACERLLAATESAYKNSQWEVRNKNKKSVRK